MLGEKPKKKRHKGTLTASGWKILSKAYRENSDFLIEFYSIHQHRLWRRLEEFYYPHIGLIKFDSGTACITDVGRWYYCHYYEIHTEMYPDIESILPRTEDAQISLPDQVKARELGSPATKEDINKICHKLCQQKIYPLVGRVDIIAVKCNLSVSPQALRRWVADWEKTQKKLSTYDFRLLDLYQKDNSFVNQVVEALQQDNQE